MPLVDARVARVSLLDGFRLHLGDSEGTSDVRGVPHNVQRLVAHLGLCPRRPRRSIAGQLWPDAAENRASANLRSALWRVQKAFPGLVEVCGDVIALADGVRVDVRELVEWTASVLDAGSPVDDVVVPTAALAGELLPGWYEDWVLLERERLRQLRIRTLEVLSDRLAGVGRYGEAVQAAYAAVREEPLREGAHLAVVRVHLAEGNLVEALRAYGSFRDTLDRELGVPPSPTMAVLVSRGTSRRADPDGRGSVTVRRLTPR